MKSSAVMTFFQNNLPISTIQNHQPYLRATRLL
jgi:hypothetical protein